MSYLTPIERMIIESLNKKCKTLEEISFDLDIKSNSLFFVLQSLVLKELIIYSHAQYQLNSERRSDLIILLKNKSSKKFEIKSILECAKNRYIEHQNSELLQVKKVFLTPQDQVLINSQMSQMCQFLTKRERHISNSPLSNKQIFYWGSQSYRDVLNYLEFN